jgi:hypothetical protein
MSELTSDSVPPIGSDDHVTGEGTEAVISADFGCPTVLFSVARRAQRQDCHRPAVGQ